MVVTWTPGTGTDDTEEENHVPCERGGFTMEVWADSFVIEFEVNGDPTTHVSEFFDGIDHDYDIGVVQL